MNDKRVSIVLGSLIGTAVLHTILVACSGSAAITSDARAQDAARMPDSAVAAPPVQCASWQIAAFYAPDFITGTIPTGGGLTVWPTGLTGQVQLPAGWEPITASTFGGGVTPDQTTVHLGALAMVRKCVQ